jgi:hypothetical protein
MGEAEDVRGACRRSMGPLKPIPETSIFDLRASRRGYRLNKLCGSLCSPANRAAFQNDEEGYMSRFHLTEPIFSIQ